MGAINFTLAKDELQVVIPREFSSARLLPESLEKAFRGSEFKHCKLDDDVWQQLAERFELAVAQSQEKSIHLRIGEQCDAKLTFRITDDAMEAEAMVEAPFGGQTLTTEQVLNQLRNSKIINGIRRQAIEQIVQHSKEAPPGAAFSIVIAKGKAAVDGEDTHFKSLVEDARQRILQPQLKDKHRVDMRDLGSIISVKAGTPVLERVPFTQGKPGFKVTGETLEGKDGVDKPLKTGVGTEISPENPNILIASVTGLPSFTDNTANVEDILTLGSVDVTTGHVEYDGSVIIDGNVAPGMQVIATGDITINGYVDSASIRASGNITITKGVIGHMKGSEQQTEHIESFETSTRIVSDATIWVAYSQYATLIARHGIFVDKQLTHCHVISSGKVHIGGEGHAANGKIIGGLIEISDDLFIGQLGAPAGTRTRIHFNLPYDAEANEKEQEEITIALVALMQKKKKLAKAKAVYIKAPKSFKKGYKEALVKAIENNQAEIISHRNQLLILRSEAVEHPRVRAVVNKVMHVGGEFLFRGKIKRFEQARGPTTVFIEEGKMKVEQ